MLEEVKNLQLRERSRMFQQRTARRYRTESLSLFFGDSLLADDNMLNVSSTIQPTHLLIKVACAFQIVMSSDFRLGKHREDDHDLMVNEEDALYFTRLKIMTYLRKILVKLSMMLVVHRMAIFPLNMIQLI